MAILNNSNAISAGGYDVNNSLRFRSSATAYLSRTFSTSGTNNKIQTFSAWVKRGLLSSSANYRLMGCYNGSSSYSTEINFSNDFLRIEFGGSSQYELKTTQVFRDPSAWYHIVVAIDTTQATSSNRIKMYVNGSQITAFATANYPAQNDTSQLTSANANNKIGANWSNSEPFDGYMAEVNFIDGQALTPSSFGETDATTGVWKPKAYSGTYGTNGFYLKFSDIATTSGSNAGLGKDFSGNTNYWTTNNISVTSGTTYDAMKDSPTNTSATVANYCVLNPLDKNATGVSISSANLKNTTSSLNVGVRGTMAVSSGKWYWETTITTATNVPQVGIATKDWGLTYVGSSNGVGYLSNATKYVNGVGTSYGATFTTGDVIGVALDLDGGSITFYKNNTSQGVAATGLSGEYFPAVAGQTSDVTDTNFGQRPFSYTPPTGYVALNTYNLPTPTILQGNKYMDATLYTGNGSTQTITNAGGFYPDLVWIKSRSNATNNNLLTSVLSGANILKSNSTDGVVGVSNAVTAFNSNGFTLGSDSGSIGVNINTNTYVAWQWLAGATSGTTTNTNGSITSFINVNTNAGFSQVYWTGTAANGTLGHGLGVAPKMIIVKCRGSSTDWAVWHTSIANTQYLVLNSTAAVATGATWWNSTSPTSSVFSVGSSNPTNAATAMVAYCWAEIAGFSKFGSYTGGGNTGASTPNANGPFIYTGFRPKFVLIKRTSSAADWVIYDSVRGTYNANYPWLYPNSSSAEASTEAVDFLSNGFKIRSESGATMYPDGATFIYAAFAESPFSSNNRAR